MWIEDGQPLHFMGFSGAAIGWLERNHQYSLGVTPTKVVNRLLVMLQTLVWGPGCMGYHHCDLGFCGCRLRARLLLQRLQVHYPASLSEAMKREVANGLERESCVRRALARHYRRHPMPDPPSGLRVRCVASVQTELKLWAAQAIDVFANAVRIGTRVTLNAVDANPYQQQCGEAQIDVGATNLLIPGPAEVYLAPSMVYHYIVTHRYRPPDAFCDAVLQCPAIGSRTYFEALRPAISQVDITDWGTWVNRQVEEVKQIQSCLCAPEKIRASKTTDQ